MRNLSILYVISAIRLQNVVGSDEVIYKEYLN